MAIKIGHAAGDELGKATGGKAGDQSGGELSIRLWYSSPWDCVLRPIKPELAEKSAAACEAACANPHIGYDQLQRNTLYEAAKETGFDLAAVEVDCECDCSSFMHVCALAGGADIPFKWNCLWTGNMLDGFLSSGQYMALTEDKYLTSDAYLKRGDVLLNSRSHTAMALGNGALAFGAAAEGENVSPNREQAAAAAAKMATMLTELPLLKKGAKGAAVEAMQLLLGFRGFDCGETDGEFGPKTEAALIAFQKAEALEADGECGKNSWAALIG